MTKTSHSARDKAVADDFAAKHASCAFCGASAERETLSAFGGRCGPCFDWYRSGGRSPKPMPTVHERVEALSRLRQALATAAKPGKAWAYALQAREEAGEPLTLAQRSTWRAALGVRQSLSPAEPAPVSASQHTPEATW